MLKLLGNCYLDRRNCDLCRVARQRPVHDRAGSARRSKANHAVLWLAAAVVAPRPAPARREQRPTALRSAASTRRYTIQAIACRTADRIMALAARGELESPSKRSGAHLRGVPRRIALPDDARVFENIDAVGVRQREGDVLLPKKNGDLGRLPQPFQRL